jgi:hypothetical protein
MTDWLSDSIFLFDFYSFTDWNWRFLFDKILVLDIPLSSFLSFHIFRSISTDHFPFQFIPTRPLCSIMMFSESQIKFSLGHNLKWHWKLRCLSSLEIVSKRELYLKLFQFRWYGGIEKVFRLKCGETAEQRLREWMVEGEDVNCWNDGYCEVMLKDWGEMDCYIFENWEDLSITVVLAVNGRLAN